MIQINFVCYLNFSEIIFLGSSKKRKKVGFVLYFSLVIKFSNFFISLSIVTFSSARNKFMKRESNFCHSSSVFQFQISLFIVKVFHLYKYFYSPYCLFNYENIAVCKYLLLFFLERFMLAFLQFVLQVFPVVVLIKYRKILFKAYDSIVF